MAHAGSEEDAAIGTAALRTNRISQPRRISAVTGQSVCHATAHATAKPPPRAMRETAFMNDLGALDGDVRQT